MEMLSCKLLKLLTYKGNDSCCQLIDPCVDKDLKDHSSHLVLHFHKVGGLAGDRFLKRMIKIGAAEAEIS